MESVAVVEAFRLHERSEGLEKKVCPQIGIM
jgi:hypothetical protein